MISIYFPLLSHAHWTIGCQAAGLAMPQYYEYFLAKGFTYGAKLRWMTRKYLVRFSGWGFTDSGRVDSQIKTTEKIWKTKKELGNLEIFFQYASESNMKHNSRYSRFIAVVLTVLTVMHWCMGFTGKKVVAATMILRIVELPFPGREDVDHQQWRWKGDHSRSMRERASPRNSTGKLCQTQMNQGCGPWTVYIAAFHTTIISLACIHT